MRELDGSDAGGQFLRTALSLAAIQGRSVLIENVRGDRSTPGLRHQHLAVVEMLADICDATVSGTDVGSETVTFEPDRPIDGGLPGGAYHAHIGTAGSCTLVFDAALPLTTQLDAPLALTATGGTDVKWAPTLDYYRRVKLPLLRRFGLQAAIEIDRRGFYPAGGGRATLHLAPSTMREIRLDDRGSLRGVRLYSTESASLADRDVAERQFAAAVEQLESAFEDTGEFDSNSDADSLAIDERVLTTAESGSPGSAICCRFDFDTGISGTDTLGEKGKPAERVGSEAATAAVRLLQGSAPIDMHLADQILIWIALAGGRVRIPTVTDHVETSLALLDTFGYDLACERATPLVGSDSSADERDEYVVRAG